MSARSLLLGLLIGATGVGGLAVTGTSPLGISFTTAAQQESTDTANQFGTGNAAAPNRQTPTGDTGVGNPTGSSSSSAPTTSSTTATPSSSSSSSAAPTTTTTPPEAPKPPAQPPQPGNKTPEQAVLELVNDQRAAKGCKALVIDDRITTAAQAHSTDMANKGYFSHESQPEKTTFVQRMKAAGYPKPGGENIAMGYATPAAVMDGWMKSQGHRENILNCDFTAMGVGLDTRGNYWTQNFGY
ncbi:CAP domain-containing protein [Lentzea aerocolonigenes]|uniref:CAP domain-containing protein n=1 Tax=Lentzea aerocolonigenes TaxID=68170 RepID=UPI000698145A|nr:CAP domain-containing protein [Lentzea aerocolonigenes]